MRARHEYILILGRPTSLIVDSGVVLRQRILPRYFVFKTSEICMFDTPPVLGQSLSDFVRVKSDVSPRPSTLTYPLEIFDRTTPLNLSERVLRNLNVVGLGLSPS